MINGMYTLADVQKQYGFCKKTVRRWSKLGKLKASKTYHYSCTAPQAKLYDPKLTEQIIQQHYEEKRYLEHGFYDLQDLEVASGVPCRTLYNYVKKGIIVGIPQHQYYGKLLFTERAITIAKAEYAKTNHWRNKNE